MSGIKRAGEKKELKREIERRGELLRGGAFLRDSLVFRVNERADMRGNSLGVKVLVSQSIIFKILEGG